MSEEKRIPLYVYDDFDPKKQEEWVKEKNKKESYRGCEDISFDLDKDILIEEFIS